MFSLLSLQMKINAEATFLILGRNSLLPDIRVENVTVISRVKQVLANHLLRRGKGRQAHSILLLPLTAVRRLLGTLK